MFKKELFSKYGEVYASRIHYDRSGRSKGTGKVRVAVSSPHRPITILSSHQKRPFFDHRVVDDDDDEKVSFRRRADAEASIRALSGRPLKGEVLTLEIRDSRSDDRHRDDDDDRRRGDRRRDGFGGGDRRRGGDDRRHDERRGGDDRHRHSSRRQRNEDSASKDDKSVMVHLN